MNFKYDNTSNYIAEGIREYVLVTGRERPDCQWINSPFDSWHENPFYGGPDQPHPEDDEREGEE